MSTETTTIATHLTANAFTRTGYSFAGWNTAADGSGTSYADGASYPFTSSTTLYAQWTLTPATLTRGGHLRLERRHRHDDRHRKPRAGG
jgi:uncharacterized repeat protein (TIGR02543 family)